MSFCKVYFSCTHKKCNPVYVHLYQWLAAMIPAWHYYTIISQRMTSLTMPLPSGWAKSPLSTTHTHTHL